MHKNLINPVFINLAANLAIVYTIIINSNRSDSKKIRTIIGYVNVVV